ncbi:MAG: GAF domain-containing protein [Anaerolineales bacterium]|nr:GAF domain-containing protein [Anaerolineales bacterium]
MNISQTPLNNPKQSFTERFKQVWQKLTAPHPSIKEIGEFRRAQLLSILTLILSVLFIFALLFRPSSVGVFFAFAGITLLSYALSKTRYYRLGTYIFAYAFTAIGYIRIYQSTTDSIELSITTTVHIALVFSSVLLSQRGFLTLVILSTLATITAPYYSNMSSENLGSTTGIVFSIGAILYGIQIFRANLDKEQLQELTQSNRELEDITANLEERIKTRTFELNEANQQVQERATRFQIISEISQEISSDVDQQPKELLNRITQSISEKLGFYHVGIFLLDENSEYAVLRAANSQGGQRMLERHHQLKVGGTGIVGYVSQGGRPRIALDTGSDAVFFNNPDLPQTKSEIALPLKYGTQVIGVLDVQSTLSAAFKDEDANLLSTLANQIAIVIKTVLINERSEFPLASQRGNKASKQITHKQKQGGYSYHPDGTISTALPANSAIVDQAIESGETVMLVQPSKSNPAVLAVPVKFRDQVIGIIHIEATEGNRRWTEDEIAMVQAISDRAGFALENARLFEETARRAEQEETIAHVTSQIGASTDFNRILQTTIQELGQALGASRSFIQLGTPSENGNKK